jgi:hypothetical protein
MTLRGEKYYNLYLFVSLYMLDRIFKIMNIKNKKTRNIDKKYKQNKLHTTKKRASRKKTFKKHDFSSGEGMLTSVWGPTLWHYLHTMSFNYPVTPTKEQKKHYMHFIKSLQNVLPCKYCRINLINNFKKVPLRYSDMKDRDAFSRYVYRLHEHINSMLGKKSGLSYNDIRERYEHFRARCTLTEEEVKKLIIKRNSQNKTKKASKEKGCTTPLYGKKSKCVLKIVPQDNKCDTFQIDDKCIKRTL